MFIINKINLLLKQKKTPFILFLFCIVSFIYLPSALDALETNSGKSIFKNYCSGCHINGGNIIRRSKNLKISTLRKDGIDNEDAIAKIAREGIGIMDGYENLLKKGEDQIVAVWIFEQAQKAWVQE